MAGSDLSWTARPANADDLPAVLEIMDAAAAWLVARGQTGQWGTTPISEIPGFAARVGTWISDGLTVLAVDAEDRPLAVSVVGPGAPSYLGQDQAARMAADALYVYMLGSRKTPAARGAGAFLMRHAEDAARAAGCEFLRLDCWAGSPALRAYYEGLGFVPCGTFAVGDWSGALYEKSLERV